MIDADALLEKENIKEVTVGARHSGKTVFCACKTYLRFAIEAAPTIDAVPVVRCKDCRYSDEAKVNKKGFLICPASGMEITDDDFCSYGERRSE